MHQIYQISATLNNIFKKALSVGALVQIATLFIHIYITPNMSMTERGDYAMVNALIVSLGFILCLGFPSAITKSVSQKKLGRFYFTKSFGYLFLQVSLAWMFFYVAMIAYNSSFQYYLICNLIIAFLMFKAYLQSIFLGQKEYFHFQVSKLLPVLSLLVFVIFIVATASLNLKSLIFSWCMAEGITVSYLFVKLSLPMPSPAVRDVDRFQDDALFGFKSIFGQTSFVEGYKVDQILVGFLMTPSALAVYAVAKSVSSSLRFIPQSISQVSFPIFCSAENLQIKRKIFIDVVKKGFGLSLLAAILLIVIANYLLLLLVGQEYGASLLLIVPMALSSCFFFPRRIYYEYLKSSDQPGLSSFFEFLVVLILFTGIFVLYKLGYSGGILIATLCLVSNVAVLLIATVFFRRL